MTNSKENTMTQPKKCRKCDGVSPLVMFASNKSTKDGLQAECKACNKAYRDANKKAAKEYNELYRVANPEAKIARDKEYYQANKELIKSRTAQWSKNNKELKAANDKTYQIDNKGMVHAISAKRRAVKLRATPSIEELSELVERFHYMFVPAGYHTDPRKYPKIGFDVK